MSVYQMVGGDGVRQLPVAPGCEVVGVHHVFRGSCGRCYRSNRILKKKFQAIFLKKTFQ